MDLQEVVCLANTPGLQGWHRGYKNLHKYCDIPFGWPQVMLAMFLAIHTIFMLTYVAIYLYTYHLLVQQKHFLVNMSYFIVVCIILYT